MPVGGGGGRVPGGDPGEKLDLPITIRTHLRQQVQSHYRYMEIGIDRGREKARALSVTRRTGSKRPNSFHANPRRSVIQTLLQKLRTYLGGGLTSRDRHGDPPHVSVVVLQGRLESSSRRVAVPGERQHGRATYARRAVRVGRPGTSVHRQFLEPVHSGVREAPGA